MAEDKSPQPEKPDAKTPELLPSSAPVLVNSEVKKKPAGAVSLFGGINVLESKKTKNLLDEDDGDDDFLSKASPPPLVKKEDKEEEKAMTKTFSLFEDENEDDSSWSDPIFTKPTGGNTQKVCIYSELENSMQS